MLCYFWGGKYIDALSSLAHPQSLSLSVFLFPPFSLLSPKLINWAFSIHLFLSLLATRALSSVMKVDFFFLPPFPSGGWMCTHLHLCKHTHTHTH